jgi:hypothetical protein
VLATHSKVLTERGWLTVHHPIPSHFPKRLSSSTALGNALYAVVSTSRVLNLRRFWGGRRSLQLGEQSEIVHQVPGVLRHPALLLSIPCSSIYRPFRAIFT